MSLATDRHFFSALRGTAQITDMVQDRIFSVARSTEDEDEDKLPYIIIGYEGMTNDSLSKDSAEGDTDEVMISLLCVADTREALAELTATARKVWKEYYTRMGEEYPWEFEVQDYTVSAGAVAYDPLKPCYYQTLSYSCSTDANPEQ